MMVMFWKPIRFSMALLPVPPFWSIHFQGACIFVPTVQQKVTGHKIMTHFFYAIIVIVLRVSLKFWLQRNVFFLVLKPLPIKTGGNLKTIKNCSFSSVMYSKWCLFQWWVGSAFCYILSLLQLRSLICVKLYATLSCSLNPCLSC